MKDYKILPVAILILKVFAWISAIVGVLGGIVGIWMIPRQGVQGLGIFAGFVLYGGLSFVYFYTISEIIQLLINLERNTRKE